MSEHDIRDSIIIPNHGDIADRALSSQAAEELAALHTITNSLRDPEAIATTECIKCNRRIEKLRKKANASAVTCLSCVRAEIAAEKHKPKF